MAFAGGRAGALRVGCRKRGCCRNVWHHGMDCRPAEAAYPGAGLGCRRYSAIVSFLRETSGSACPLVWAHSEYIKLVRSLRDGKVLISHRKLCSATGLIDQRSEYSEWRFNNKMRNMPPGKNTSPHATNPPGLCIGASTAGDLAARCRRHGSGDTWSDLPTKGLTPAEHNQTFTFFWPESQRWEGTDYLCEHRKLVKGRPLGLMALQAHRTQADLRPEPLALWTVGTRISSA